MDKLRIFSNFNFFIKTIRSCDIIYQIKLTKIQIIEPTNNGDILNFQSEFSNIHNYLKGPIFPQCIQPFFCFFFIFYKKKTKKNNLYLIISQL